MTGGWRAVTDFPDQATADVRGVIATDVGFVAVGSVAVIGPVPTDLSFLQRGAVWTSSDGERWMRIDSPSFERGWLTSIAAGPDGTLMATGAVGSCLPDSCPALPSGDGPAIWLSRDAAHWERQSLAGIDGVIAKMVATSHGFVAFGSASAKDLPVWAIWSSVDGITWQRAAGFGTITQLVDIAATPFGIVVLGREADPALSANRTVLLVSSDGSSWEAVSQSDTPTSDQLSSIAAVAGGVMAIGTGSSGSDMVGDIWRSSDGRKWAKLPVGSAFRNAYLSALAVGPSAIVLGGSVGTTLQALVPTVWFSPDGLSWSSGVALEAGVSGLIQYVAARADRAVAFGLPGATTEPPGSGGRLVWVGPAG